jgi:hypothetical protein
MDNLSISYNLGSTLLHPTNDDEMMEIFENWNSIQMKILNDIACNLNWIQILKQNLKILN